MSITLVSSIFVYNKNYNKDNIIPYTLFLKHLNNGLVKEVYLNDTPKIKIVLDNNNELLTDNPRTEGFKEALLMHGVDVIEKNQIENQILPLLILISLAFTLVYFRKNISKQAEKEMASMSVIENSDYSTQIGFKDVAGNKEAKASLGEIIDYIKNPEIYKEFGVRLPRGVLLYGSPGTGKTLLAKAVAGEANVPFYPVSGSDFVQVYAGLGASRIRDLFKKAKEAGKSVIFIDEIDCIGKKRNNGISGSEEGDRTLNALLAEMSVLRKMKEL